MALAWLGYAFGFLFSIICRQSWMDAMAVAVETGVQNTGIAIFILRVTLEQPAADINTVVPVAVAIFTPLPLFCIWILQKCILHRRGICLPGAKESLKDNDCTYAVESQALPNGTNSVEKLLPVQDNSIPVVVKVLGFTDYWSSVTLNAMLTFLSDSPFLDFETSWDLVLDWVRFRSN